MQRREEGEARLVGHGVAQRRRPVGGQVEDQPFGQGFGSRLRRPLILRGFGVRSGFGRSLVLGSDEAALDTRLALTEDDEQPAARHGVGVVKVRTGRRQFGVDLGQARVFGFRDDVIAAGGDDGVIFLGEGVEPGLSVGVRFDRVRIDAPAAVVVRVVEAGFGP